MTAQIEFLRQHAIQNVWCAPGQDRQYIFTLPRISNAGGSLKLTTVTGYALDLPDATSRWQLFQIGGVAPSAFGMLTRPYVWVNACVQANEGKSVVRLFSNTGVVAMLNDVYYRYTQSGNLVVAVRMHSKTPINWTTSPIYLHIYSNAYWKTADGSNNVIGFSVAGALLETAQQITAFASLYLAAAIKAGASTMSLSFWHNGMKKDYAGTPLNIGDSVFFELDGSIKKRVVFPVSSLETFDSTLDSARKYLLHPPKDNTDLTIDYFDDNELFLVSNDAQKKAILYPRTQMGDVRQLTHRDYSINVSNVVYQSGILKGLGGGDLPTQSVELVLRHSGYNRTLIFEHSFIHELYKLPDDKLLRAFVGTDATVPFWRAAYLEASAYPALMRARDLPNITYPLIESAYGYHAMAKALANTPSLVSSPGSNGFVTVPYLLMHGATAYEYDDNGLFLGWYHHYVGSRYYTNNQLCRKVELLAGIGGTTLEEMHGSLSLTNLSTLCNWRVYLRQSVAGQVQTAFEDVTGSNHYTLDDQGNFNWSSPSVTDYPTVRSDRRFYAEDFEADVSDGRLAVTLTTTQKHLSGILVKAMGIPLGQSDVILNGRSLIRDMQYFHDSDQIVIAAREYIDQTPGAKQKIHVRMYGFCRPDGSLYPEGDYGFIQHGLLSNNNRFDVRDGRITRVVVDGALHTMDDLVFSEESTQVAPIDATNGQPYMVKDVFVPLKPFTEPDTWGLIEVSRTNTQTVSDYMTRMLPQPTRGPIQAITRKHELVSPFLAKILYDLLYGRLSLSAATELTRQTVMDICKPYESMLNADPLSADIDTSFVVIQPHTKATPISVTPKQWAFMSYVIDLYAAGRVDIHSSLSISS